MDKLNTTIVFVILLIALTELDKIMYKKLDEDYKKFILTDDYNESKKYNNSSRVIQVIKNIENHTGGRNTKTKLIGFMVLLLIIYFQSVVDKIYYVSTIKVFGIIILITIAMLSVYNLIKGIKEINEFKSNYNKDNVNLEILYVILHSLYFFILIIVFYL